MDVEVHKGRQNRQAFGIHHRLLRTGQGRQTAAHRLDFPIAEVKFNVFSMDVHCMLYQHDRFLLFEAAPGQARAKKNFSQTGKVQILKIGNKPAAKKPAAKHIFSFLAPQTHDM